MFHVGLDVGGAVLEEPLLVGDGWLVLQLGQVGHVELDFGGVGGAEGIEALPERLAGVGEVVGVGGLLGAQREEAHHERPGHQSEETSHVACGKVVKFRGECNYRII